MGTEGLRERKKEQTRAALSWAALRLSVERGYRNVLVEDIAADAGVSPRTFNNYFASKAEAIVWRHINRAKAMSGLLRDRPRDEPLWTALAEASASLVDDGGVPPDPDWVAGVRLMLTEPEVLGEVLRRTVEAERTLAEAIAERTGMDAGKDLYPRLVAAALSAAQRVASEQWMQEGNDLSMAACLREAIGQLAAGLPEPPH
ncbi:TetR family transcriptional regulator [Labedaea rhizosphaerae]|uniref:TetR family transcriptional regulator n=1 Tax=Labedaea rhizosphaerae TaxID=598644 RepID=A0A4R6SIJ7_LABRH|nr:TetR family transcriptional regulator [Labedaea rhizosphaerae]TDQ01467.1 TetR family transcriptional regulator [Labedaea rhizosphaerae]